MILTARGLVARFGAHPVLDGIDFEVGPGELVGLIGPNGAGKSTLLRLLAGLRRPDGGAVTLDGRNMAEFPPARRARALAYLPQGGEVHWPLRADAVVGLGRLPHRAEAAPDDPAVARAMQATGTAGFAARTMDSLSGGERMRVLLARALAVEAPLLLADEPVAALDPLHQLRVMRLLRETAQRATGIVAVLHDLSLAARFASRLVLLAGGKIIADGAPADVLVPMHLKRAYGVDMIFGMADGIPYVMPRAETSRAP